jgi:hypothetical protein
MLFSAFIGTPNYYLTINSLNPRKAQMSIVSGVPINGKTETFTKLYAVSYEPVALDIQTVLWGL